MKKLIRTGLCAMLMLCFLTSTAFADDLFRNTLNDQVTLTDIKNFKTYTVGYTIGCNCSNDWDLQLIEQAQKDGSIGCSYMGTVTIGSTFSAQINCASAEEMSIGIIGIAADENGEELKRIEDGNGYDSREMIEVELVVPENTKNVSFLLLATPRSIDLEYSVGYTIIMEMTVNGKEEKISENVAAPIDLPDTNTSSGGNQTSEQTDFDWIGEDKSNEVDGLGETLSNPDNTAMKGIIRTGITGIGLIAAILAVIKRRAAKKAAAASRKVAKKETARSAVSAKTKPADMPKHYDGVDDSYVVTDPTTGAQTLYVKDAAGNWVSSDGNSVLDTDRLPEWKKQRAGDRVWQNKVNKDVKRPTRFEDIDKKQALEKEQIHREGYHEKIAIRHGMDASDMDSVFEKVSHDQVRAEADAQDWMEIAEHNDMGLKIAENLKTAADYSVTALGAVTGPTGTFVKDIYAAGTTIGGDVAEAVEAGKDIFDVAQTAAGAVTKSAVSVIQNHASGVVGKSTADILGGATTGGIDAYVKGKNVAQGITKGTASGAVSAVADTMGEMAGALRDGSSFGKDAKDFAGTINDILGDFVKNNSADAINESFDKTFEELNRNKKM